MKICIISEGKVPPDSRTPLTPKQCESLRGSGIDITMQSSGQRCYSDDEYAKLGIPVKDHCENADIILGVKEVPVENLMAEKTYFMFSHTIKKQPYNRELLQAILEKKIRLIDYEVLTDQKGNRVIAFGHFAGMVGAHNGIWTYGQRTGLFELPRMQQFTDYAEARSYYKTLKLPPVRIVLTGKGRVAGGAALVLGDMGIRQIPPDAFLHENHEFPVFTQIGPLEYARMKNGDDFTLQEFFTSPQNFDSDFAPYSEKADIFINGIYWDPEAPAFFTKEDMTSKDFKIKVIADITCDIAPESSVPSTLRATTIADPVFGYDPAHNIETSPYSAESIDVMSIDNLPNELPRDASRAFGEQFIEFILPELKHLDSSKLLKRGTIAKDGRLTEAFSYLQDYVEGKE